MIFSMEITNIYKDVILVALSLRLLRVSVECLESEIVLLFFILFIVVAIISPKKKSIHIYILSYNFTYTMVVLSPALFHISNWHAIEKKYTKTINVKIRVTMSLYNLKNYI